LRFSAGFTGCLGLGLLAGCLTQPAGPRETVVQAHVTGRSSALPASEQTASPENSGSGGPHSVKQTYEPYRPPIPGASGTDTTTGVGNDSSSYVNICGDCNADAGTKGPSLVRFSGQSLYAGPFTLPKAPVVMRVSLLTKDPATTMLLYLDSGDSAQSQKNLLVEAKGSFSTTFKYKEHPGFYAFYLQVNPLSPWTIEVFGPSPSPIPSGSGSPSPSPSTSPSASSSVSPSVSPSVSSSASPSATATASVPGALPKPSPSPSLTPAAGGSNSTTP
jgi:hypothetical protein